MEKEQKIEYKEGECGLCRDWQEKLRIAKFSNEDNFVEELWICPICYEDYERVME